jgi:NitT/TauT family transport system ATP-binding protein
MIQMRKLHAAVGEVPGQVLQPAEALAVHLRQPMVSIENLSKFYLTRDKNGNKGKQDDGEFKRITALDKVSATIGRGEFVSLLGPSGCGKTTLLRIAAGLTRWDEGTIAIDGKKVVGPRKDGCMVFQHFGLMPWRSVLSNIEFPLELDGISKKERRDRAEELLQLVGLTRYANHLPHEISGGMQQRVSIARALMRQPSMLYMDEPFGALDAQTRERLQDDFLKIWAKFGTTVLFVTHSIDEALVLSDRIFVFSPGPGRIKDIVDSPLAGERIGGDPRQHPQYGKCRGMLREMLSGGEA